jgi:hypothetical protein
MKCARRQIVKRMIPRTPIKDIFLNFSIFPMTAKGNSKATITNIINN